MKSKHLLYFKKLLESQLETLKEYIDESYESIKKKQKIFEGKLSIDLIGIDYKDEEQEVIDRCFDDYSKYYKDFPSYFNEATFLILYSFFESNLAKICEKTRMIVNKNEIHQVIQDPKKTYILDSKKFLVGECKILLDEKENIWFGINHLREFRNFIAHDSMDLVRIKSKKQEKLDAISYINEEFGECIKLTQLYKYRIENHKFINEAFMLFEQYLYFVIDQVDRK